MSLDEDQLVLNIAQKEHVDKNLLEELKQNKFALIDYIRHTFVNASLTALEDHCDGRASEIPLSFGQERLWFVHQAGGSVQYHSTGVVRLTGRLDEKALASALRSVVDRHHTLRTVVEVRGDRNLQRVIDSCNWHLDKIDIHSNTDHNFLESTIKKLHEKPFDLKVDFMFRATLLRLVEGEYRLVITMHHIASDGWSLPIIVNDLTEFYRSQIEARRPRVSEVKFRYADFSIWQHRRSAGEELKRKISYWKDHLSGIQTLELLPDFSRSAILAMEGDSVSLFIEKGLTQQLRKNSTKEGVTLFMTLLAAFKILLFKYTGQGDIAVGSPVAGRDVKEVEQLVGFFNNAVVLRASIHNEMTFRMAVAKVKEIAIQAFQYQDVPFEKVVEAVGAPRDQSRNPLFDIKFALHNVPSLGAIDFGADVQASVEEFSSQTTQVDISFDLTERNDGIELVITYRRELYRKVRMQRMASHFLQILRSVTDQTDIHVRDLIFLAKAERDEIINIFNGRIELLPDVENIISMFTACVQRDPNAVALIFGDKTMSYERLDELSSNFAVELRSAGVEKHDLVAICTARGMEMIVGILGILKAGAAYVPIDPEYPDERIVYILDDTSCKFVCSDAHCKDKVSRVSTTRLFIDINLEELASRRYESILRDIAPEQLAYLIYTSGSSGKPKGVMIEHRGVVNLVKSQKAALSLRPGIRTLQFASFSFDASCYDIFNTLLHGGALVMCSKEVLLDGAALNAVLKAQQVELITIPPSYLSVISEGVSGIKTVVSAGESLSAKLAAKITSKGIRILNAYGPTENTVCATLSTQPVHENGIVTIGRPIDNVAVYIMDKNLRLLPIGIPGEICIAGNQLSRGYFNNEALTEEVFIKASVVDGLECRLYRTGDIGRWLPDGNIEYLGRNDEQVKIRGFRIELAEVQRAVDNCKGIAQGVVVVKSQSDDKHLLAFVIPDGTFSEKQIYDQLAATLPAFMLPESIIMIDKFPTTTSGKVDKAALVAYELSTPSSEVLIQPQNAVEEAIALMWRELLNIERVGINQNFFDLGGHSLLVIRMLSKISKEFSASLSVGDVFKSATIAELARLIGENGTPNMVRRIPKAERPEHIPLAYSQERLWFIDKFEGSVQYHIPGVLRLRGRFDVNALEQSFRGVINRHETLRTVIDHHEGIACQRVLDEVDWFLRYYDEPKHGTATGLPLLIKGVIEEPFDLSRDLPIRATLVRLQDDEAVLVVVQHHIAGDGWSLNIFIKEFVELYSSIMENRSPFFESLSIQFADYAIWQRSDDFEEIIKPQLAYWEKQLRGVEPLSFPGGGILASQPNSGALAEFTIPQDLVIQLDRRCHSENVTRFMFLLTAFKILLYRYTGQEDICIGSAIANRSQAEIAGLIGFFANSVAIRSRVFADQTIRALLATIRDTTINAYERQDVPFEKIVEAVVIERTPGKSPIFQVMFDVLEERNEGNTIDLGTATLSRERYEHSTSKFDLTISLSRQEDGLRGSVEYRTALFSAEMIQRLIGHYLRIVNEMVVDLSLKVGSLRMLGTDEELRIMAMGRNQRTFPDKTVPDVIEEMTRLYPDQTAVITNNLSWTYRQLDLAANRLAHALITHGVTREALVPVLVDRGVEMFVALLAVWKAGGAYVPIDPEYPQDRIRFLLEDAKSRVFVKNARVKGDISEGVLPLVVIDYMLDDTSLDSSRPSIARAPSDLAYVIYTSGSTGVPKGVMIEHCQLFNYVFSQAAAYGCDRHEKGSGTFHHLTFSFDASVTSIFVPLVIGRTVVTSDVTSLNPFDNDAFLKYAPYDFIKLTPAHLPFLKAVCEQYPANTLVRKLIIGGEVLHAAHIQYWRERKIDIEIVNEYGPTEATVGCSTYHFGSCEDPQTGVNGIVVGTSLPNVKFYVMDGNMCLLPQGLVGEVCIGGVQVARGYFQRPELTAARFVSDPYGDGRIYRSGDLGRWADNGVLEYVGRRDNQIKLHGYRIELGEIEKVLLEDAFVSQAVVVLHRPSSDKSQLVAYVVCDESYDQLALIQNVKRKLPQYMIPSVVIRIASIPLKANGKIDVTALPQPDQRGGAKGNDQPPTEQERMLTEIWQDVLGVERVSVSDNFFKLGGDSITTIQVVSRARKAGIHFQVADIFDHQTIAELLTAIGSSKEKMSLQSHSVRLTGSCGLMPIQQWYFNKPHSDISHFNQSVLLQVTKVVPVGRVKNAIAQLLSVHDGLCSRYSLTETGWEQRYTDVVPDAFHLVDLSNCSIESMNSAITFQSNTHQRALDIENGKLVSVVMFLTPEEIAANRLLIIVHHLVIDGVSWRILLEDLEMLVTSSDLPENPLRKSDSLRDWVDALSRFGASKMLSEETGYWRNVHQRYVQLPFDKIADHPVRMGDLRSIQLKLSTEKTQLLVREAGKAYNTDVNDLLLTALGKAVANWCNSSRVSLALEGHGREVKTISGVDLTRTVGWFTSLYPVSLEIELEKEDAQILKSVKEQIRQIPNKGIGYGVLKYINQDEQVPSEEPWDLVFNYLGQFDNLLNESSVFSLADESPGDETAESFQVGDKLTVQCRVINQELVFKWYYSTLHFEDATIERLSLATINNLNGLVELCISCIDSNQTNSTPSDFGLASVMTYEEMDNFLNRGAAGREDILDF